MSEAEAYVGIDVSKAELEVAVEDEGGRSRTTNLGSKCLLSSCATVRLS